MLSTVAALGSKPATSSSWKLDNSSTHTSGNVPASRWVVRVSSNVGPMLPATATRLPERSTSWPVSDVTVVLPLVPVIASTAGRYPCVALNTSSAMEYKLNSPPALIPQALAAINTGAIAAGLRPGER
ncbi:hypothetical protein D3C71_1612220 [compost metagenome]